MDFRFADAVPVLRQTPSVVDALLRPLPESWVRATEGQDTWSPFDVVGHLIHGERTDWIPRCEHLLRHGESVPFPPFDRFAMFAESKGKSLAELLDTFRTLRAENLVHLDRLKLADLDLEKTGRHPELGRVTLKEHLATWVAHDLSHVGQIVRVMGRQYAGAVGPWRRYLPMLQLAGSA